MVDDLLKKGLVRPSKSTYASPDFLVPKSGGDFWMVVVYRKVNSEIIFNSYPLPKLETTFEHFGSAVVFKFSAIIKSSFRFEVVGRLPYARYSTFLRSLNFPWGLRLGVGG
jgi:hypothetical protein